MFTLPDAHRLLKTCCPWPWIDRKNLSGYEHLNVQLLSMNIQSWFVNYSVEAMCLLIVTEAKWHLRNYSTATDVRLSNGGPMAWVQRERFSGQLTELWLARILANVNTFISVVMHLFIVCMFWIPVMSWHCCCDFCWWQMFEVVRVFYGSFSQFSLVGLKIIKKIMFCTICYFFPAVQLLLQKKEYYILSWKMFYV